MDHQSRIALEQTLKRICFQFLVQLQQEVHAVATIGTSILRTEDVLGCSDVSIARILQCVERNQLSNDRFGLGCLRLGNLALELSTRHLSNQVSVQHQDRRPSHAGCLEVTQGVGLLDVTIPDWGVQLRFQLGNLTIDCRLVAQQTLNLSQGVATQQVVHTGTQEHRRQTVLGCIHQILATVGKSFQRQLSMLSDDRLAQCLVVFGLTQQLAELVHGTSQLRNHAGNYTITFLECPVTHRAHVLQEPLNLIVGHRTSDTAHTLDNATLVVLHEVRCSNVANLRSGLLSQLTNRIFCRFDDRLAVGTHLQCVTLLGFDVHQLRNQGFQLGISCLATKSLRDLLVEELHDLVKDVHQTLRQGLASTDRTSISLGCKLQQIIELLVGQTQGCKPGQVIRAVAVRGLHLEDEVVVRLRLEVRWLQLSSGFHVQLTQLTVGRLGQGIVAFQGCFDRGFHLLHRKVFLRRRCKPGGQDGRRKGSLAGLDRFQPHRQGVTRFGLAHALFERTKRPVELLDDAAEEVAQVLLEFRPQRPVIERLVDVQGRVPVDGFVDRLGRLLSQVQTGLVALLGLGRFSEQTRHVADQHAQTRVHTLVRALEEQLGQGIDKLLHTRNQGIPFGLRLHLDLDQHILLETLVGHAPGHQLLHIGHGCSVLSQAVGFDIGLGRCHQAFQFSHQLGCFLGRIGNRLGNRRMDQLVQQGLGRQARVFELRAQNVDRFLVVLDHKPPAGIGRWLLEHFAFGRLRGDKADPQVRIHHTTHQLQKLGVDRVQSAGLTQEANDLLSRGIRVGFKESHQITFTLNRRGTDRAKRTGHGSCRSRARSRCSLCAYWIAQSHVECGHRITFCIGQTNLQPSQLLIGSSSVSIRDHIVSALHGILIHRPHLA